MQTCKAHIMVDFSLGYLFAHLKPSSSGIMDKGCGFESHLVDEQYLPFQQYSCSAVCQTSCTHESSSNGTTVHHNEFQM